MKPTQTEYKGVVYRSKCEAMFARYLDTKLQQESVSLRGYYLEKGFSVTIQGHSGFLYEPHRIHTTIDNWNPDFVVWRNSGVITNRKWIEWIEYKPARPTQSYVQKFAKNCLKWHDARSSGLASETITMFRIYYGNPYTYNGTGKSCAGFAIEPEEYDGSDITTAIFDAENDYEHELHRWLENYVDDLMAYRFDLEESNYA